MLANAATMNTTILLAVCGSILLVTIFLAIFMVQKRRDKIQRQILNSQMHSRANTVKYKEGYATTTIVNRN